ncbi:flagellin [Calditerrivibrio nitroreducens]|uniref:Flagellin n=1 Tax=Calditerrivibrio nitroreducens (strain DSM 19672 / NBRC 101217 / Yu37-1) TaxID=768670 RepID=E4TGT9_CALNY|nr:flagellin [Calditerrivibrio nitroreducens]ADR18699.1 flagellin domain protein [Calditerrivibrio nitroreducens DSM 19672]
MAMIIYNNIPSLTAQRYVGISNTNLAKSLEKLSSGLRINHASDDASGLAISEKLRGQISGLKRAAMNAQDGISMLQTAEGAMGEVHSILQRMRELAVQASNGIYTTNDRKYIQDEVDQLKSEINRISASTEFNTKKLLNGDATALWSADSNKLDTIIRGRVAEGNYNITVDATPGQNYIYKTDVMTLKDGAYAAEFVEGQNGISARKITDVNGLNRTINNTSVYTVDVVTTNLNSAAGTGFSGVIATYAVSSATSLSNAAMDTASSTVANLTTGYYEIEALASFTGGGTAVATFGSALRVRFYNATNGTLSDWTNFDVSRSSGGTLYTNISLGGNSLRLTLGSNTVTAGDKVLFQVSNFDTLNVSANASTTGAANVSIVDSYGKTHVRREINNFVSSSEYRTTQFYIAEMNSANGSVNYGSFKLEMGKMMPAQTGQLKFEVAGPGDRATDFTQLKDIARFVNADGRNIFDNTQALTIFGNGKSTTIYLEGSDTIKDFEDKLTSAIKDGLGMGNDDVNSVNDHLVDYVKSGTSGTPQAVAGTFVIQSALLGEDSRLSFIGDQALIDGLSLATIQQGKNSELNITVTNAHTGETIGSDVVNDYTLKNIIKGVDVKIDSSVDVTSSWNNTGKKITFVSKAGTESMKLHLVDNATELQIGANEGQTIEAYVTQLDTKSLGLNDVYMVSQELAQKSITKIDRAIEMVSGMRATIGAQVNRLEYAISNLNVTRENLVAAESRIRDLDVAAEMATFTRWQILNQSGTAMLAQANQLPQLALQLLR